MIINRFCQAIGCKEKVAYDIELKEVWRYGGRQTMNGSYCRHHMIQQMKYLMDIIIDQK